MKELREELARALLEWRDAGGPVENIVEVVHAMIDWEFDRREGPFEPC